MFSMGSLDERLCDRAFPPGCEKQPPQIGRHILLSAVDKLLSHFVDLKFCNRTSPPEDHVHAYACEVLSLGLMLMEFNDAIKEGDGTQIIHCWTYFILLFKANNRSNYAIETFTLLVKFDFLLPHRLAHQLSWSCTVNTRGKPG